MDERRKVPPRLVPSALEITVTVIIYLTGGPADDLAASALSIAQEGDRERERERVGQRGVQFRSRANDNFNARIHHEGGHGIRTASCKSREPPSNGINLANSDAA